MIGVIVIGLLFGCVLALGLKTLATYQDGQLDRRYNHWNHDDKDGLLRTIYLAGRQSEEARRARMEQNRLRRAADEGKKP